MNDHTTNSETGREQPNEAGWSAQPPTAGQQQPFYGEPRPPFYGQQEPGPHQAPPGYGYGQQDGGRPPYGAPYRPPQYPPYARPYTDNTKIFSILSYIGILWLVGLIADRGNPRVRFHVNQGIILTITQIVLSFVQGIFTNIVNVIFVQNYTGAWTISPLGHAINGLVSLAVGLISLAFIIIGVIHAAQDREEPLPIIGTLFTILR